MNLLSTLTNGVTNAAASGLVIVLLSGCDGSQVKSLSEKNDFLETTREVTISFKAAPKSDEELPPGWGNFRVELHNESKLPIFIRGNKKIASFLDRPEENPEGINYTIEVLRGGWKDSTQVSGPGKSIEIPSGGSLEFYPSANFSRILASDSEVKVRVAIPVFASPSDPNGTILYSSPLLLRNPSG